MGTLEDPPRVRLHQVTKRYGDRIVLHDLDLTLPPARLVTVEGANGSGKSTLLRLISGVARPTSGSVAGPPGRVGYLSERFDPPRMMRADAYLRHLGRISGLSPRSARARTDALIELLAIRPGPSCRLGALSKGNLQKVGLAQVFLADHDLIVLDEPRTALETSTWPVLDMLMADHVERGALVVRSEHDPDVLAAATDRVQVRDGSIARHHSPPLGAATAAHFRIRSYPLAESTLNSAALVAEIPAAVVEHDEVGTLCLRVPVDQKDSVLRWLLRNGWSVTRLEPDERA